MVRAGLAVVVEVQLELLDAKLDMADSLEEEIRILTSQLDWKSPIACMKSSAGDSMSAQFQHSILFERRQWRSAFRSSF
jgi:hypothetical protein